MRSDAQDGSTPALTRQALLARFQTQAASPSPSPSSPLLAVIGITACAVGVDLSKASFCVFLELPPDAAWLCQAEDRLHRPGQRQAGPSGAISLSLSSLFVLIGIHTHILRQWTC